eukprot:sb/3474005/
MVQLQQPGLGTTNNNVVQLHGMSPQKTPQFQQGGGGVISGSSGVIVTTPQFTQQQGGVIMTAGDPNTQPQQGSAMISRPGGIIQQQPLSPATHQAKNKTRPILPKGATVPPASSSQSIIYFIDSDEEDDADGVGKKNVLPRPA